MKILVCAEIDQNNLCEQTAKTVTAGRKFDTQLNTQIDLLVVGHNVPQNQSFEGISQVRIADHAHYAHANPEMIAALLVHLSTEYDAIIAPSTSCWKNILPRFCAKIDMMALTDVIEIIDATTYKRPIYAGNAIATLENKQAKKIMTIRPTAFESAASQEASSVDHIDFVPQIKDASTFIRAELSKSERPQLTSAKIVVSGGRGVGSEENFKLIQDFADQLNAAIGASRAAVDAGYVPNDYQVGHTGKIVAPNLYIAIGISGAIQHLAGMKESKIIAAINKDPDAPIFNVADVGIVGDLFEIIPQIQSKL